MIIPVMTGHPDNANLPPLTEAERREMQADGHPCDPADWCRCGEYRYEDAGEEWEVEREGWTTIESGDGLCEKCKEYVTPTIAQNNEASASAVIQGQENCGGVSKGNGFD